MFRTFLLLSVSWLGLLLVRPAAADNAQLDRAIAKHRQGTITIKAQPGTAVQVVQLRHEFWFGAALSNGMFSQRVDPALAARYKQVFLENFNSAVTENALKWHSMERRRGEIDYSIVDAMLDWTAEHEIPLRGHNIYWGVTGRVQDWQKALDDQELREVLKDRGAGDRQAVPRPLRGIRSEQRDDARQLL